jgi:hypothetical protein
MGLHGLYRDNFTLPYLNYQTVEITVLLIGLLFPLYKLHALSAVEKYNCHCVIHEHVYDV